jgi:hypothetical protein
MAVAVVMKSTGPVIWLGLIVAAGVLLGPPPAADGDDFRVMWLTGLGTLTLLAGAAALGGARITVLSICKEFAVEVLLSAIPLALVGLLLAAKWCC